jgi:hypothetical protein
MTNMLNVIEALLPDNELPYTVPEHVVPAIAVVPAPVIATAVHDPAASHVPTTVVPPATVNV